MKFTNAFPTKWAKKTSKKKYHRLPSKLALKTKICSINPLSTIGRTECRLRGDAALLWETWNWIKRPKERLLEEILPRRKLRDGGKAQHILTCQLRSVIPRDILNKDWRRHWDFFRITTPAVNSTFDPRNKIETITCYTVPNSKSWCINHVFQIAPFRRSMFRISALKTS